MSPTTATMGTRDRLISAMLQALRTRGYHGVGLNELLSMAQAPKGVLYHHFPGGKAELAVQAIETVAAQIGTSLDRLRARSGDPVQALGAWMDAAEQALAQSGFERGCPLATIALESGPEDESIRRALAQSFATVRERLAALLIDAGLPADKASGLAALIVSAYEGALLQARVAGSVQAMRECSATLMALVRMSLTEGRPPKGLKP